VKLLQQAIADGANLIKPRGDAGLGNITKYAWGNRLVHSSYTWMWAIEHGGEHYASLWSTVARTTWCRRTRGGNAVIRSLKVLDCNSPYSCAASSKSGARSP
jgi:hypothetical protein